MKTKNDFIIENNKAILVGVSYAEEAKVVDEFLNENQGIKYVQIVTKDGRNFKLSNGKLIFTKEESFINPYYIDENKKSDNPSNIKCEMNDGLENSSNQDRLLLLERRLVRLEDRIDNIIKTLKDVD